MRYFDKKIPHRFLFVLFTAAFSSFVIADNSAKPQRIASLNLCLDALLLKLVEPERINSLTYISGNPQFSPFAKQAQQFHLNRGLAEDLVPRNPDLILAGDFGAVDAKVLLKQLSFRVETLSLPRTLADISSHILHFGELTGSQDAAGKMVQELEAQLVRLDANPGTPIPAFWYASNSYVVGGDTLENELMTRAGFHNLAVDKNISGFAQLDLEDLILAQPKVIIVEASDVKAFSLAQEYIQHPALRKNNMRIIKLPATLSVCIAPIAVDVIENLIQQKKSLVN